MLRSMGQITHRRAALQASPRLRWQRRAATPPSRHATAAAQRRQPACKVRRRWAPPTQTPRPGACERAALTQHLLLVVIPKLHLFSLALIAQACRGAQSWEGGISAGSSLGGPQPGRPSVWAPGALHQAPGQARHQPPHPRRSQLGPANGQSLTATSVRHPPSELRVVVVMVGSSAAAAGREGGRGGGAAPHAPVPGGGGAAACCCWRCCCASWCRVWVTPPWWWCSTVPVRAAISAGVWGSKGALCHGNRMPSLPNAEGG